MGFFDEAYGRSPPWEIGRAQREFVALEASGAIVGDVLDVGCGTGENALYLASRGYRVVGVDSAPRAVDEARRKAEERGLRPLFMVVDALDLSGLGRTFGTVIDSGLFHTLSDSERPRYARSLSAVLGPGGTCFMLAFSDREPGEYPLPRRISRSEIRTSFSDGWRVCWTRPAIFESRLRPGGHRAWLSSINRI